MSACLNPQGSHTLQETAQRSILCSVPGCGFLLAEALIDGWHITRLLHHGPVADLYLLRREESLASKPEMVMKVLRVPTIQPLIKLEQGFSQLLALRHPHIHPVERAGMLGQSGPFYLLSRYEEQGALLHQSGDNAGLPSLAVASIVRQIAEALHFAHEQALTHGRLKPENCLLIGLAAFQVSDFYSCLLMERGQGIAPHYMAPEQVYGPGVPASDQYALAILAFRLLTGQLPFTGADRREIITQHIQNDPPPLSQFRPDLPRQAEVALRRGLGKRPGDRFPDITTFAAALQTALESRPGATGPLLPHDGARPAARSQLSAPPPPIKAISRGLPTGATPICILPGHTSAITVLCWAPDGAQLASAGPDQSIRLWSIQQHIGTPMETLAGQQSEILALAWSPDNKLLASAAADARVHIWDVSSTTASFPTPGNKPPARLQAAWWGHDGPVNALEWSPDGTRLASGGADRTIRLWDKMGKALAAWQAHGRGGVTALAWAPDGRLLATGGVDRQIRLWDHTNGGAISTWEGHSDEIQHLAWSPDGSMLASSASKRDGRVLLWNPLTGQQIGALSGHTRPVIGLFWSPDGSWLASGASDQRLRFWSMTQPIGQQISRPIEIEGSPISMAGVPGNGLVALGTEDMMIFVLRLILK